MVNTMKEVASSIVILSAVFLLIAAEHFDSFLFWALGGVMMIDGAILFIGSTLFPRQYDKLLEDIDKKITKTKEAK